jgi:uncharacterized protein (DUF2267 family)
MNVSRLRKAEEFVKLVMQRTDLSSRARAQNAVRATLETLSEHLIPGEARNSPGE